MGKPFRRCARRSGEEHSFLSGEAMNEPTPFLLEDLGRLPYAAAWECQRRALDERLRGARADTLLLVEHDPVITVGRGGGEVLGEFVWAAPPAHGETAESGGRPPSPPPGGPPSGTGDKRKSQQEWGPAGAPTEIPGRGEPGLIGWVARGGERVPVFRIERGGRATYHGPGQLVGYPIFRLAERGRTLEWFLRGLEGAICAALETYGIRARGSPGSAGVWAGGHKVASIGVAVRRWVTWHGFAVNVTAAPRPYFGAIRPCGLEAETMTSVSEAAGRAVTVAEFKSPLLLALRGWWNTR
jgi:lipoate-protein ligase B